MYDPDTGFLGLLSLDTTGFVFSFHKISFSMDQALGTGEGADASVWCVCFSVFVERVVIRGCPEFSNFTVSNMDTLIIIMTHVSNIYSFEFKGKKIHNQHS